MKLIKEFNLFKGHEEEEIVEVLNMKFDVGMSLKDLKNLTDKLINKNVTFTPIPEGIHTGKEEIKMRIDHVSILFNPHIPALTFYVGSKSQYKVVHQVGMNVFKEVKIWGKRKYTKDDPYGEEDWHD